MGIAKLVLENGLAVDQVLHFVGERAEGLYQSLDRILVAHPIGMACYGAGSCRWKGLSNLPRVDFAAKSPSGMGLRAENHALRISIFGSLHSIGALMP